MAKEPLFRLAHMQHLGKTMWTYFYHVLPSFPSPFYSLLTYLCSLPPQKGNIPSSDHSEHPPPSEAIPVSKKKHCFLFPLRENFWMVASPSSPFDLCSSLFWPLLFRSIWRESYMREKGGGEGESELCDALLI